MNKNINGTMVEGQFKTITPEEAERILRLQNPSNRAISDQRVRSYAQLMQDGGWVFTGESIIFDTHGHLVDGQHRLSACAKSGVPLEVVVIKGVDRDSAMPVIDTGKGRTLSDALHLRKYRNTSLLGAAINHLSRLLTSPEAVVRRTSLTNVQGLALIEKHPDLIRPVRRVSMSSARSLCPSPAHMAACLYVFENMATYKAGDKAEEFEQGVIDGVGLQAGDPRLLLRDTLMRMKMSRVRTHVWYQTVYTIRAWNSFYSGKSPNVLPLAKEGRPPIPRIKGWNNCPWPLWTPPS